MREETAATSLTILAALQGNETDRQVIRMACFLAGDRGATLRVVYPIEVPLTQPLESWNEESEARAQQVLAQAASHAEQSGCVSRGTVMPTRGASGAILDEAVEWAANAIVLASPFRSRLGDASLEVLKRAPCSVLLWRP